MSTGPQPPTGDRIASEVEREMEERLYRLRHVVLAPAEYHIYLHPDDFKHIEDVAPRIALDVQLCLNSLVERLNRRSRLSELIARRRAPIEIPPGGWAIYLKPALNNEVGSRRARHSLAPVGASSVTLRERRGHHAHRPDCGLRHGPSQHRQERSGGGRPEGRDRCAGDDGAMRSPASSRPHPPGSRPAARLTYTDDRGAHGFRIGKELIKIGRGGNAHWVDLTVVSSPKVSREHCRIRRDSTGRFFIQDVSAWGTFLNGKQVPKFVDGVATQSTERELTDGAVIRLADAVTLEFRVE